MSARLFATSDIHISHRANREALDALGDYPDDWLIVAGDVGERVEHLEMALGALVPRFARVIWTPGNHDLWCPAGATDRTRGQARYDELVGVCQARGVLTPEDSYATWPADPALFIVPTISMTIYEEMSAFRTASAASSSRTAMCVSPIGLKRNWNSPGVGPDVRNVSTP